MHPGCEMRNLYNKSEISRGKRIWPAVGPTINVTGCERWYIEVLQVAAMLSAAGPFIGNDFPISNSFSAVSQTHVSKIFFHLPIMCFPSYFEGRMGHVLDSLALLLNCAPSQTLGPSNHFHEK